MPAVRKMQVDVCCPFRVVFLVYRHVIVVAGEKRLGSTVDLDPGVALNGRILGELGLVHHDAQLMIVFAALGRERYQQVMVAIAYERDFHIVSFEFLRDFFAVVDAVLDESAAFDFPAVVDAAACG